MGRQKNGRYQRSLNSSNLETRKRAKVSALNGSENRRSYSGKVRLAIEKKHRTVRDLKRKTKKAVLTEQDHLQTKEFESGFESESETDCHYSKLDYNDVINGGCHICESFATSSSHSMTTELEDSNGFCSEGFIGWNATGSSAYNSWCSMCSCHSSLFSSCRSKSNQGYCPRSLPSSVSSTCCPSCRINKAGRKRFGLPFCTASDSDSWSLWEVPKESGVPDEGFPPIECKEIRVNQLTQELEELSENDEEIVNENVSLGLIYVPMTEEEEEKQAEVVNNEGVNEGDEQECGNLQDGFGSLESLIFQPKEENGELVADGCGERNPNVAGKAKMWKGLKFGDKENVKKGSGDTLTSWKYFELGGEKEVKTKKRVTWKMIKSGCSGKENGCFSGGCSSESDGKGLDASCGDVKRKLMSGLKNCFRNKTGKYLRNDLSIDRHSSWSDLESLIFADHQMVSCARNMEFKPGYSGRMNSYHGDWWMFWDQQRKSRRKKDGNSHSKILPPCSTWKAKSKRMLLWMFQSQASLNHGKSLQWSWWKAKQRSSILWLIAKANNNKVPDDLKEPYYRDHEDQDQLKPVIIHALASAECYCLALGNIYADPNYHRLNHWGVIQALARKGVYVAEPSDVALTETVLIQTSPIRMSAHMAVIEAIMALYIKETVTTERIVQAIKRFSSFSASNELPADTEEALVLWINKSCVKMKHRIEAELHANDPEIHKDKKEQTTAKVKEDRCETKDVGDSESKEAIQKSEDGKSGHYHEISPPQIPILRDLSDLGDGCCLATLLSFYCPSSLKWQDICYNVPMTMSDSLYNLQLVQKFCRDYLPFNPCVLTLEDLVYQHSSVRQNILAFLSDLFFLLEIKPAKCVQLHSSETPTESPNSRIFLPLVGSAGNKRMFQQSSVSPIPDLRSSACSSMPDINRISPKSAISPHSIKEPMFPRRPVVTQPETRTLDRAKRNSVHEGSRGQYGYSGVNNKPATSPGDSNSMRRVHSLLEVSKTMPDQTLGDPRLKSRDGVRTSNGESRFPTEADSEPDIYYVHRSQGFTQPLSHKVPDRIALDELDEVYSRADNQLEEALPIIFKYEDGEVETRSPIKYEEEKLMPAKLKPAKEKTNVDSKVEERGEYDRRVSQSPQTVQNQRTKTDSPRRYASEEGKENRLRSAPEQLTHTSYSADNVPKHSMKISQARVGESFSYPEKYSLETAKAAGVPIIPDENYVPYEGFHDNRELEEQLANQNFSRTTLYVPGGDNKTQYIIIQTGDKGKEMDDNIVLESKEPLNTTSFAQLSKLRDTQKGGINIVYMQHDRDHNFDGNKHPLKSSFLQKKNSTEKKTTTFASLPNTTTWSQQQAASNIVSPSLDSGVETPSDGSNDQPLAAQVHTVRLKLEEKRRRIETEKRKMELMLNRARQKVGKAAFLQAVSKGKGSGRNTPDSGASGDLNSPTSGGTQTDEGPMSTSLDKSYTMEEIADNLNMVQNKWLESQMSVDTLSDSNRPSPDVDGVSFEEYTRSLERLNANLNELQGDIQRLSQQQVQMQRLVHNGLISMPHGETFYVDSSPSRQQWGPPQQHIITEDQLRMQQNQQRGQWGPTVVSVRPDVHVSSGPGMQQRMGQMPSGPFYMNQDNYSMQHQPPHRDGFSLPPQQSSQNGPAHDQYTSYVPYNVQQYGGQVSYHQQMQQQQQMQQHHQPQQQQMQQRHQPQQQQQHHQPQQQMHQQQHHQPQQQMHQQQHPTDMYGHYTSPQPQAAPFRLHVEGPLSVSQQQSQMVYQKPVMSQSPQRPTSIHSSAPSKTAHTKQPPDDYMEPQAVHFIEQENQDEGDVEQQQRSLNSLESLVGTSTYRVRDSVSPNRPVLGRTFRMPKTKDRSPTPDRSLKSPAPVSDEEYSSSTSPQVRCTAGSDKGFFVSLDDEQPRKAKPPLRMKKTIRSTSRDEDAYAPFEADGDSVHVSSNNSRASSLERSGTQSKEQSPKPTRGVDVTKTESGVIRVKLQPDSGEPSASVAPVAVVEAAPVGFVIAEKDGQTENTDEDEMAKKKERILLNALRRKEEQELKRARQEQEGAQRREQERIKQEMLERKREDERARRQAILDQYKQRKALEDQEPLPNDMVKTSTLPKSRAKQPKQRPKSLHESAMAGSETRSSNLNLASSGGRGSQQNLSSQSSDTSPYRGYSEVDVGIGRSTPPRRAPSPGQYVYRNPLSPGGGGPPSLPPGLVGRRGGHVSDTASDTCSTTSLEYTGPKLFKQPTAKSNRGIIINAINTVLAGAVNQETKKRALEEIAQCDSKHFLILFRDSGCQFRALYSFYPDKDEVYKLFGTGPKQVTEQMIDRYYKYNSGGKSFMEIQTKHLTVTIDAFTIHNTLWQGKKGTLPRKELY